VTKPEFELKIGVVSHPAAFEDRALPSPRFRVDPKRDYPLLVYRGRQEDQAGSCRVRRKGKGLFVAPNTPLDFPSERSTFYGAFLADEAGNAALQEVLLVIRNN
jgi:hypothetical protein